MNQNFLQRRLVTHSFPLHCDRGDFIVIFYELRVTVGHSLHIVIITLDDTAA